MPTEMPVFHTFLNLRAIYSFKNGKISALQNEIQNKVLVARR